MKKLCFLRRKIKKIGQDLDAPCAFDLKSLGDLKYAPLVDFYETRTLDYTKEYEKLIKKAIKERGRN